jgi:chemotaxis protein methyltransferase CheR
MATALPDQRRLSPETFRLLRDLIYQHCGIFFADDNAYIIHRRLQPRLDDLSLADFAEYYRYLISVDGSARKAELEEVVDRVTTNETYFFRESYQLDAFRDEILPELYQHKPRGRRLSVWSAGCSSGEEAYTIAILIMETGLFNEWDVRVFGNDISRRCLHTARKAQYGRASFRATDERLRRRYFREVDGKQQVRDEVRALCSFGQINLIDDSMMRLVGDVDVVFCRNVLIYFDAISRRKVIATLHKKLVRGGYLLLGHSESLINVTTAFDLVHLKNDMVYRKPAHG